MITALTGVSPESMKIFASSGEDRKGGNSSEMKAFMRMFMDLVGIFNEENVEISENTKLPGGRASCT